MLLTRIKIDVAERCVVLTTRRADAPHAFHSRVFVPKYGIPEDPVTGSAHCALALFWAPRFAAEGECDVFREARS